VGTGENASPETPPLFDCPVLPGTPIGKRLRLLDSDGKRAVYFGSVVIHIYDAKDKVAEAACIAMLSRADLASDIDIATAFGCHRNTVGRLAGLVTEGGLSAVVPAKRGPKGPHKVTPEIRGVIEGEGAGLGPAALCRLVYERTGVVLSRSHAARLAVPAALQAALPIDEEAGDVEQEPASVVSVETQDLEAGSDEPAFDPPATLPRQVRGQCMGLALYYPALCALGLLEESRRLFRLPRPERFGVRAVFATLFFMTLLHRTTVESAKHLRRAEFGAITGAGRAPAVKTLRRKLSDLVQQQKSSELGTALARRWVDSGVISTAYLYVDGHMKVYSGHKRLQEVWNSQRRTPLPGIHSYFVGDQQGRPLLFLTEEISTNLAKAMPRVVASIREVLGDRRFTVIFDRGGYDGKLFSWLVGEKIDFITYQKGSPGLPQASFSRRETRFEGRRVRFFIAEDEVSVGRSGPWRRVVVRARDGHQTPILTSHGAAVSAARIAALMFARWRQENLFKYMGAHHGLDDIVSYAADPADPDVMIPNPKRKALDRRIAEAKKELNALKAGLGGAVLDEPRISGRSAHGLKVAQGGTVKKMRDLEARIEAMKVERRELPDHVTVADAGINRQVMRHEAKAIVDRIKIATYNAEEWMLDRLVPHCDNHFDVRDLLRSFAELSGTIDATARNVVVSLDPPDTPAHRRALRGLIEELNAIGAVFPGTDLPVNYQVRVHHSELAA
jgi:hypothetical protein